MPTAPTAEDPHRDPLPLRGRVALVTGVSRRGGIGYAVARQLAARGASLFLHHHVPWDRAQVHGADPGGMPAVLDGVREALADPDAGVADAGGDFTQPHAPQELMETAVAAFGHVDVLVCNHAHSSDQSLPELTATELDAAWAVNARASALLTQAFAAAHDDRRNGGRVILFTSGQHLAPMSHELPYAISKGAIHQMTLSLSDALVDRGITVNTVNPGPVDTGWATPELTRQVAGALPARRWGRPADVARLVGWLACDDSAWITGQVIDSEGGFRRWAM